MCGIFCAFSTCKDNDNLFNKCKLSEHYIKRRGPNYYSQIETDTLNYKFLFSASILWLQGENLTRQPIINNKSVFIYNGDIFGGDISQEDCKVYGDTNLLLNKLERSNCIIETLSNVYGPYAFIYLDCENMKLYFGRDVFGRRSLLISKIDNGLMLTSVASKDILCMELPAIGIFSYDLSTKVLTLMPWNFRNNNFNVKVNELKEFLNSDLIIEERLQNIVCKEFTEPTEEDLNVFEEITLNLDKAFDILSKNRLFCENINILNNLLVSAISNRISTQPKFCKNCFPNTNICDHSLIGILFSGGLDCTILALLSDKIVDQSSSIDLINVAFEKDYRYDTPDRKTGLESFNELKTLRPNRLWNFIEVNITMNELNEERSKHIRHLIHPLNSILDDSLGCALWFASRGRNDNYETPSRVLLVGMGADELFGGYTRHRAALKRNGWSALHDSLNEDWQNISHRNLARDDRVVSDHGRQLRTPYLDEQVVEFARNLNCWEKTCPSANLPAGLGDKILLRTLAYHLGLKNAAIFKKRALQFGSRIANSKENAHHISPRL